MNRNSGSIFVGKRQILAAIYLTVCFLITANAQAPTLRANGKIAFTSDRDGNREIYVMNNDGTKQIRLTNDPGIDDYAAWSPDGRRIAYLCEVSTGSFAICLMNGDGTGKSKLTSINHNPNNNVWNQSWSISWSPDGTKIAFQEPQKNRDIFSIDVDTGNRANLTNHPAGNIMPAWSPVGSKIAFVSYRSGTSCMRLHVMNSDGSNMTALPCSPDFAWADLYPDWSPEGRRLVYTALNENDLPIIYIINADGTGRYIFDHWSSGCEGICGAYRSYPKWSPDGTKIVFSIFRYVWNIDDSEIFVKDSSGTAPTQLTNTQGNNFHPSWQSRPRSISPISTATELD